MPPIPYEAIAEALQEGAVVPFLGAGVNFGHRPSGNKWTNKAPCHQPNLILIRKKSI